MSRDDQSISPEDFQIADKGDASMVAQLLHQHLPATPCEHKDHGFTTEEKSSHPEARRQRQQAAREHDSHAEEV